MVRVGDPPGNRTPVLAFGEQYFTTKLASYNIGPTERVRTSYLFVRSEVLFQMSYGEILARQMGLEPTIVS